MLHGETGSNLGNEKHELALDDVDAVLVVRVQCLYLRHAALLHHLPLQRLARKLRLQLLERELQFPDVLVKHSDLENESEVLGQEGATAKVSMERVRIPLRGRYDHVFGTPI